LIDFKTKEAGTIVLAKRVKGETLAEV